ncbi:MAG: hypothetical protein HYX22_01560 [Candidatus Yanofskybacteria bacterium]|nr:hypothetical protein [Candidatus Yanofskybacteria bacterium]
MMLLNKKATRFLTILILLVISGAYLTSDISAAPNEESTVIQINNQNPGLISSTPDIFTNLVACALWQKDSNWGRNGKRGNPNDLSNDAIAYKNSASIGLGGVDIIDIIGGVDGPDPQPGWIDVTQPGVAGVWVKPDPCSGAGGPPGPGGGGGGVPVGSNLGISGDTFTIGGVSKFLVLASYFDALDASNLGGDLDYLKSKGIDGIRIFPNWWDFDPDSQTFNPGNTLMDVNGNISSSRMSDLLSVLSAAKSRNMIVDVTFARETVPGPCDGDRIPNVMCMSEFMEGTESAVRQINSAGYGNVFFDIQNEFEQFNFSNSDLIAIKNRIKSVNSNFIVSASEVGGGSGIAVSTGMDIVNTHEPRDNWPSSVSSVVSSATSTRKPIYLGESARVGDGADSTQEFITAVSDTKRAGGAAWTFHSRANFNLDNSSLQNNYNQIEKDFLDQFLSSLNRVTWGATGITSGGGGTLPPPGPGPGPAPEPSGPPIINGISPQKAVVGETVEIIGSNLTTSVKLENLENENFYTITAFVRQNNTIASFQVPDLSGGVYKIFSLSPQGDTESPQNLTIRSGGNPFGQSVQPTIPTEGLLGFGQLIAMIFTWSLNILGIVVFVMIFFAGFQWFTAAGNTAKVNEAKSRITNAITGALILLAAWIILYTINPDLVGGTFTLPGAGIENSN